MIRHLPKGAKRAVILAHGRGSNAADIMGLLDYAAVPDLGAIALQAPGNSWWPTSFLAPQSQMAAPLAAALLAVDRAVSDLTAAGFARSDIWLAGFSQGAVLALEYLARSGVGLAGAFGFSGGLVGTEDLGPPTAALYGHADKAFGYAQGPRGKVWISVHERDPHIPLKRAQDSAKVFRSLGAEVRFQTYPGAGHQVTLPDIEILRDWLGGDES